MHASPELELVRPPVRGDSPFPGCVLLIAPHMDDETLGCGALMASYEWANSLHVAFATDGARSPVSRARRAEPVRELPAIRRGEAFEALRTLGVAEANVHFFDLPDGELRGAHALFRDRLLALTGRLRPTTVLVPFRYDRHPDHLAVNRVTFDEARSGRLRDATVVEYFVYAKWRLLPSGDVRSYLRRDGVLRVEPHGAAATKRRALECYRSQTTLFYGWQKRPILTRALLDAVCADPEIFVIGDGSGPPDRVFVGARAWIPVAHRLEPVLKRGKDRVLEWLEA